MGVEKRRVAKLLNIKNVGTRIFCFLCQIPLSSTFYACIFTHKCGRKQNLTLESRKFWTLKEWNIALFLFCYGSVHVIYKIYNLEVKAAYLKWLKIYLTAFILQSHLAVGMNFHDILLIMTSFLNYLPFFFVWFLSQNAYNVLLSMHMD